MFLLKNKGLKLIFYCLIAYIILCVPVSLILIQFTKVKLIWNLILAFIPLPFALLFQKSAETHRKKKGILFGLLWLLFFPNAPYIITDFIHISGIRFYSFAADETATYSTDILAWLNLAYIGTGVILGVLMGFYSLYVIHKTIIRYRSKRLANIVVVGSGLLCGYAIYLGRIPRLNSWDFLNPIYFLTKLYQSIGLFPLLYSLIFACFVLFGYFLFYVMVDTENKDSRT
ncbi:MAG: hypothetical protein BGN88_14295 [Clostridiales bacterium 43-6]|nr:MAG: hypothetical protein BGN88_14295 [Clostridiales bacterium 43-6]